MLKRHVNTLKKFHEDESGDIVQTAIIIGVLALIAIAALTILRDPIRNAFNNIKSAVEDAGTTQ